MAEYTLEAQPRVITGKQVGRLRRSGLVPATIYGPKMQPINIQMPYRTLELTLRDAGGTSLIDVIVEGKIYSVLTREVQRHNIRRNIMHVDFFALDLTEKIRADVPVQFVGESPAVQAKKGILMTAATTLTVEVLPANLMHFIEIDLSTLKEPGAAVYVRDLDLGPNVTIVNDPEELIVRIAQTSAARSEEELLEEDANVSAEPEVIHKGKQEEEDF